jgi:hypothetical protein
VEPAGTVCRSAAGVCDVAEECTGVAGQACPADDFATAGTPCDPDANICTVDQCDGSGACTLASTVACDDGNACTQDACDPVLGCVYTGQPATTCQAPVKATLDVKYNQLNTSRDLLKFNWKGGPVLVPAFGDPINSTRYELCVYDASGVRLAVGVPPGFTPPVGPGWKILGTIAVPKGYKYKDVAMSIQGVKEIKLLGSSIDRANLKVVGKGPLLPDDPPPFQLPVTAQLYSSDGNCWEAVFDTPMTKRNEPNLFKGKLPPPLP